MENKAGRAWVPARPKRLILADVRDSLEHALAPNEEPRESQLAELPFVPYTSYPLTHTGGQGARREGGGA